ncbi:MAG: ABC transporter permease [Burkholderiales bacterium]
MFFLKLIAKNAFRHRLRTGLTVLGIIVAILAFGLLRTIVHAWYAGVDATSTARLVTRNAISLVFPLPITYANKIRQIPGVTSITYASWFGGIYISEKNFFPQFAVDPLSYFDIYPEFVLPEAEKKAFLLDRKGTVVGRKLAQEYGWNIGDVVPLRGTIYPGNWDFVVRGIYDGVDQKTDQSQFFFQWHYLNETLRKSNPGRAEHVGVYILRLADPALAPGVGTEVDIQFNNSLAETLTETEKAFQLGFVSMTEAILIAIQLVSFVVIIIIMAVMANTMAMSARERMGEFATLKAMGFPPAYVVRLIFGESLVIAIAGGVVAIALTFPVATAFAERMGTLFPIFYVSIETVALQVTAALLVGSVAAMIPAWRIATVRIVDGLRSFG